MTGRLLALVARVISGASVRFTTALPDGRRVFIANHSSHLDFLVIWASLPERLRLVTRPVAAADYWRRGRLRRHLAENVFRALLVERGTGRGREAVEMCAEALREGDSLILFPEGTRGDGETVGPFKAGIYHLANQEPELQIVPVHLENMNRVLPKGEGIPVPVVTRVTFGAPFTLADGENKEAFLERAREAVVALR